MISYSVNNHNIKKKVKYYVLEKNVILDGVGGKTHIEGISRALKDHFNLTIIGERLDLLDHNYKKNVELINVLKKTTFGFYLFILKDILKDNSSNSFLYRKTILGLFFIVFGIILKKISGSNQKHFIEVNGISGDYGSINFLIRNVLFYINCFCFMFFDGVYCVNKNISNRINESKLVNIKKNFVCQNGGFGPLIDSKQFKNSNEINNLNILFYGTDNKYYEIDTFRDATIKYNQRYSNNTITLHLIGPGLKKYASKNCINAGELDRNSFIKYVKSLNGFTWGLLPLRNGFLGRDLMPIKLLDYSSLGIPTISSYVPLAFDSKTRDLILLYKTGDIESIINILNYGISMDVKNYNKIREEILNISNHYDWKNTLQELVNRL